MSESTGEELYYIHCRAHGAYVGNCMLWWAEGGSGYTCDLDKAWKVTGEEADRICRDRPDDDIPYLASVVDANARRHADHQGIPLTARRGHLRKVSAE